MAESLDKALAAADRQISRNEIYINKLRTDLEREHNTVQVLIYCVLPALAIAFCAGFGIGIWYG